MLFGRNPIEKKLKVFYEIEDRIKKNPSYYAQFRGNFETLDRCTFKISAIQRTSFNTFLWQKGIA